jgi:hypothetical protein
MPPTVKIVAMSGGVRTRRLEKVTRRRSFVGMLWLARAIVRSSIVGVKVLGCGERSARIGWLAGWQAGWQAGWLEGGLAG